MNGVRFYEEFSNKRKGVSEGNVVAVLVCNGFQGGSDLMYDGIVPVYSHPNSGVASSGVSVGYLRSKCKRITEAKALQIHPELFTRLDTEQS